VTITDLLTACSSKGVRLANAGGKLKVAGPDGALTPALLAGCEEHKSALLAVLPPEDVEREGIIAEGNGEVSRAEVLAACEELQRIIDPSGCQDWRVDWVVTAGVLVHRVAACADEDVRQRLLDLVLLAPKDAREWAAYSVHIRNAEAELRSAGKLPPYFWPRG
jgi:TubC N-terminal docking domain